MSLRTVPAAKAKEGPRRIPPPPRRSGPIAAVRFVFIGLPMMAAFAVRRMPWWKRLLIFGSLLALAGVAAYFLIQHRADQRRQAELAAEWKSFDEQVARSNVDGMKSSLARIEKISPGDPLVQRRRQSIERGEADAGDTAMLSYWMGRHRADNRLAEAAREARKRVAAVQDDWLANCILAEEALTQKNVEKAIAHLKAMPSPMAQRYNVPPSYLSYAMALHRETKLDDSSLRQFRATKLAPAIKDPRIADIPLSGRLDMLACYVSAFEDLEHYTALPDHWAGSAKTAQLILDDPDVTTVQLVKLGILQDQQIGLVQNLVERQFWSESQAAPWRNDLFERLDDIWKKVRERDPKIPEGYLGAAFLDARRGRPAEALRYLERGQEVSSNKQGLIDAQARMLRNMFQPEFALTQVEKIAERNPGQDSVFKLVSDAALAAGRLDKALEAAQQARKLDPRSYWAGQREAEIHLKQDRPVEAAEALKPFEAEIGKDPAFSEIYVRTLCLAKKTEQVKPFIEKLVDTASGPEVAATSLRAAFKGGLHEEVAVLSTKLTKKFSDYNLDLLLVNGDSNITTAEPKTESANWDRERVDQAIWAFERVLQREENMQASNNLAWAYLKGLNAPDIAERKAEPLRKAEALNRLPETMYGTLGMISLGQSRYDEARRLLLRSFEAGATAEKHLQLALAYHHLSDSARARDQLVRAAALPMSPRLTKEFKQVQSLIDGTKP